jgi:hypothetical protein
LVFRVVKDAFFGSFDRNGEAWHKSSKKSKERALVQQVLANCGRQCRAVLVALRLGAEPEMHGVERHFANENAQPNRSRNRLFLMNVFF